MISFIIGDGETIDFAARTAYSFPNQSMTSPLNKKKYSHYFSDRFLYIYFGSDVLKVLHKINLRPFQNLHHMERPTIAL